MPDIIDQLSHALEEPDIQTLLYQSIDHSFHHRYPHSRLTISSTEDPDTVHVLVEPPHLTYDMVMSDDWTDTNNFLFTFTCTTSLDTIVVDLCD